MAPMMIITRQYERGFQFILFPRDDFKLHSEVPIDFLVFSEHVRDIGIPDRKKELSWKSPLNLNATEKALAETELPSLFEIHNIFASSSLAI
jgi:hypothetical protein